MQHIPEAQVEPEESPCGEKPMRVTLIARNAFLKVASTTGPMVWTNGFSTSKNVSLWIQRWPTEVPAFRPRRARTRDKMVFETALKLM